MASGVHFLISEQKKNIKIQGKKQILFGFAQQSNKISDGTSVA